jgi:hypothetical protein
MVQDAELALSKALKKLKAQRDVIDRRIKAIRAALAALGTTNPNLLNRRRRRPMSKAERRAVSRRMRAYWTKRRLKKATR